jgi:hypothetical protein
MFGRRGSAVGVGPVFLGVAGPFTSDGDAHEPATRAETSKSIDPNRMPGARMKAAHSLFDDPDARSPRCHPERPNDPFEGGPDGGRVVTGDSLG